jgi:ferric-dicitrate binding protein FerR (iron transport regulator)
VKLASRDFRRQNLTRVTMQMLLPKFRLSERNQSRRRRWRALTFAAALAGLASSALSAPTFTATLDRDTVAAGESATLTLKFEGGQP